MPSITPELEQSFLKLHDELKTWVPKLDEKYNRLQRQVDAIDCRVQGVASGVFSHGDTADDPISTFLAKFSEKKAAFEETGRLRIETPSFLSTKSTITSTGLYAAQAATAVAGAGRFPYMLRRLFRVVPAITGSVFNLKSNSETISAAPQSSETAQKAETTSTFTAETLTVATIAHFVNVSKNAMDDIPGMAGFLDGTLLWGLEKAVENQLISGDGSSGGFVGLSDGATSFDTSYLSPLDNYKRHDVILAAAAQLRVAGYVPDFCVLHPVDFLSIRTEKDLQDRYQQDPGSTSGVWDLNLVQSNLIAQGGFLIGDSSKCVLRVRQVATVDLSYEHANNFTYNLVTIRAEERLVPQILRPDAYVKGSIAFSPAAA